MQKYVEDIQMKRWAELIKESNETELPRGEWLKQNNITRDCYYYWLNKVRKYYAEQNGLIPVEDKGTSVATHLVEVPVKMRSADQNNVVPAAVIHINQMCVEINATATGEFMENLGRMIHNAL